MHYLIPFAFTLFSNVRTPLSPYTLYQTISKDTGTALGKKAPEISVRINPAHTPMAAKINVCATTDRDK